MILPISVRQNEANLYINSSLPIHDMALSVSFHLAAKELQLHWNFPKQINDSGRCLSQNMLINLDLTKTVNITEGLVKTDKIVISGLWHSTHKFKLNELFVDHAILLHKKPNVEELMAQI